MSKRPRGPLDGWQPTTTRQKGILTDLIARFEQHRDEDTLPRGPRGIFYDLRPNGMGNGITYRKPDSKHPVKSFRPMEAHPDAVQEVLVLARRAGIIEEDWVADTRAPDAMGGGGWDDADQLATYLVESIETAAEDFRLDPQRFQPLYIEVLCEAEDLQPRLHRHARDYRVPVNSGAGFGGLKGKIEFAERAIRRDVPTVVLDIGDRDAHGEYIYLAAAEDAVAWAGGAGMVLEVGASLDDVKACVEANRERPCLIFYRLALTTEQAEDLDLLDADGKAEADAIPVRTLDGWLTDAIEHLQDSAGREAFEAKQEAERERLPDVIRERFDEAD
jgi:hypothetical protein